MTAIYPVTKGRPLMYDGIAAASLPTATTKAAGYVNGKWPSQAAIQRRFPNARVRGVDVNGSAWTTASVLDWERGDVQDASVLRKWIAERNAFQPQTACIYVAESNLDLVEEHATGLWHVLWVANWGMNGGAGRSLTGSRSKAGNLIVATQLQNTPGYDMSDTLESW